MSERRYLPTFADLVDRLTIVQLKEVFIPEHAMEYRAERALIGHDIDLLLASRDRPVSATDIHAIAMIMLANRVIWENESKARTGESGQDKLLKFTHSINGVRNTAKNVLAAAVGERVDHKTDCFAADLIAEFGNWNVFEELP